MENNMINIPGKERDWLNIATVETENGWRLHVYENGYVKDIVGKRRNK